MTEIPADLAEAGRLAGMHDPSDLALLDLANLPRDAAGRVRGARDVVEPLRRDHPALFHAAKLAKDMSPSERAAGTTAAELPPPEEP